MKGSPQTQTPIPVDHAIEPEPPPAAEKTATSVLAAIATTTDKEVLKKFPRAALLAAAQDLRIQGVERLKAEQILDRIRRAFGSRRHGGHSEPKLTCDKHYGVRCGNCGEVAISFDHGFDPRRPESVSGRNLPFELWPISFIGYPHQDEAELAQRSRKDARCPRCEWELPILQSGLSIAASHVVELDDDNRIVPGKRVVGGGMVEHPAATVPAGEEDDGGEE